MSERHQIVRDLFESCLEHQNPAAFLADHCFDPTVRQEVEALLSAHNRASSFLESPPTLATSDAPRQWVGSRLGVRTSLLRKAGRRAEAVQSAKAGLALARADAERPGAGPSDFNEYAHWLTNCEVPQLRNPALALQYAMRSVQGTDRPNAVYLDTLAWAYYRATQGRRWKCSKRQSPTFHPLRTLGQRAV